MSSTVPVVTAEASTQQHRSPIGWIDLLIALGFAAFAAVLVWNLAQQISYSLRSFNTNNVWFESDVGRTFANMLSLHSDHYRTKVHPIFSVLTTPLTYAIYKYGRVSADEAVNLVISGIAGIWTTLSYLVLRRFGFDRLLSTIVTFLGLASASSLLFMTVPETYSLASAMILGAIGLWLVSIDTWWEKLAVTAAGVFTLGITITNWTLGLLIAISRGRVREAVQVSINAFFVVVVLWTIQKQLMPSAEFFTDVSEEGNYTLKIDPSRVVDVAGAFFFHSLILPRVTETQDFGVGEKVGPDWTTALSLQGSVPGSGSVLGAVACVIWAVALVLGFRQMLRARSWLAPTSVLLVYLFCEFVLHTKYGVETFMYALNWLPVLLIAAAFGLASLKRACIPLALALLALVTVNNVQQFTQITATLNRFDQARTVPHPKSPQEAALFHIWACRQ